MTLRGTQPSTRGFRAAFVAAPALLVLGCASAPTAAPTATGHSATAEPAATGARPAELASREVSLAEWGLEDVDALRYARVGVLHQESPALVVYHLGADDPESAPKARAATARPPLADGSFVVADYRHGSKNRLGGYFNGFARAPARATVAIEGDAADERALVFDYRKEQDTYAGFWIHLFETRERPQDRTYLDASELGWLTFEVRGASGGEALRVQLADRDREQRQDSVPLGDLASYLPTGQITTGWQRAWVPLSELPERLDRSQLASVIFLVEPSDRRPASGRLHLRDVAFTVGRVAPASSDPDAAEVRRREAPTRKAMWLWETAKILAQAQEIETLAGFVREHGFTDIYVQIPYIDHSGDRHWSERWNVAGMQRLITRMSSAGARVHALDGAAWYARPEWHDRVVVTARQIATYNAASPSDARFHGLRYDIEPYLLPEWQGARRQTVLSDYLVLLRRLVAVAHGADMEIGVDIPFWFDARDEITGQLAAPVDGRSAAEAIIDVVDNIGIMDYRTTAFGADGVLAHAEGELSYATARGKEVLIGLETVPLPDETIYVYDSGRRSAREFTGDLVVEPLPAGRARLTFVPRRLRREQGDYGWAAPGRVLLRQRDSLDVPASKITFAGLRPADLEKTMRQARPELEAHPSFAGFIIHSYESYRPWLARRGGTDATASPRRALAAPGS